MRGPTEKVSEAITQPAAEAQQQAEPRPKFQQQDSPAPEPKQPTKPVPRSRMVKVLVALLVLVLIVIISAALFQKSVGPNSTTTASTAQLNVLPKINQNLANASLIGTKDVESVFGSIPANNPDYLNFSNPLSFSSNQTSSSCLGGENYAGSLLETNSGAFTNKTLRAELEVSLPLYVYSNYVVMNSSNFNFYNLAANCPQKISAVGSLYEENFSVTNVSSIIGAPALLFVQKNFTPEGLNTVGIAYTGPTPAISLYFLKFEYKNSIWTVGEYVFANSTAVAQALNLSKTLHSELLHSNV